MPYKKLNIVWQRLMIGGSTCPRCGGTEKELEKAVKALKSKGITVEFSKKKINKKEFDENTEKSNKIIINGKALESWLAAKTGSSTCCDTCGDSDCRTVEYRDKLYETIPKEIIIKAALIAVKKKE